MKVNRFNEDGMQAIRRWHVDARAETATLDDLGALADDDTLTEIIGEANDALVPDEAPDSRHTAAALIHTEIRPLVVAGELDPATDDGFWTWLAAEWRDHLVKPSGFIGEMARWVSELGNTRRFYRHLLAGPYLIYARHADHPERTRFLLSNKLHTPGELAGQVGASPRLLQVPSALDVGAAMYWNDKKGRVRSNVRGKGAGSARRLTKMLNQFDRTYSLEDLERNDLGGLLPEEFPEAK